MYVIQIIAGAFVIYFTRSMYNDSNIRETTYSAPLATMPANVDSLAKEMLEAACADGNLTATQVKEIETGIYKILSEGAVLQRNHELTKTREIISYSGQLMSWFMKAQGLTYEQIVAKYEKDFSKSEIEKHKEIILSAARPNSNLFNKMMMTISKKLGLAQAKL